MSRLPIRVRLTAAFALVMAVALTGAGAFVYLSLRSDLDATIDSGLRSRAADVTALAQQADEGLSEARGSAVAGRGGGLAQIVGADGRVLDATPPLRSAALLTRAEVARSLRHPLRVDVGPGRGLAGPTRLLATPVRAQDRRVVVVVTASLVQRDAALDRLGTLLLIGGPILLLLACLAGYGLATAALRPVESMRRQADAISDAAPGRRLPVPPNRDEVARLGGTLNAMLDRLEAALAHERAFVADASHELRTPLAVLKAELELAHKPGRSEADRLEALAAAAEETDRLARLANDLLVIARVDRGKLPIRRRRVRVDAALDRAVQRATRNGPGPERAIAATAAPDLVVDADPIRLDQALDNLIDNALRYGGAPIELRGERNDGWVELHVRDGGSGFPEGYVADAFERFSRADASRRSDGSGLGLAIVQAIATAHGGEAHVANRPEGGADVWLALRPRDAG